MKEKIIAWLDRRFENMKDSTLYDDDGNRICWDISAREELHVSHIEKIVEILNADVTVVPFRGGSYANKTYYMYTAYFRYRGFKVFEIDNGAMVTKLKSLESDGKITLTFKESEYEDADCD